MSLNLYKRFYTSLVLILFLVASLKIDFIMTIVLFSISVIIFSEFFNILVKIPNLNKNKILLNLIIINLYLCVFSISIFYFLNSNIFNSKIIFVSILLICASTDIGGYIFGKTIGGKKITTISPNKTYAGVIGSYILSFLTFLLISSYYEIKPINSYLVILISTISQIGDLFISYLKRKAHIKDTGSVLPGHGGLLDRLDGMIFAIPLSIFLIISLQ